MGCNLFQEIQPRQSFVRARTSNHPERAVRSNDPRVGLFCALVRPPPAALRCSERQLKLLIRGHAGLQTPLFVLRSMAAVIGTIRSIDQAQRAGLSSESLSAELNPPQAVPGQ